MTDASKNINQTALYFLGKSTFVVHVNKTHILSLVDFHTLSHTVGPCCCPMLLPHVFFQCLYQTVLFKAHIVVFAANTVLFQANTVVFFSKYSGILCKYSGI